MPTTINGNTGVSQVQDSVITDGKLNLTANSASIKTALNASGNAPIYACRAWVNFNGTGTVAIRASGNVSSITDNSAGNYTINFTTAMPDADYCVNGTVNAISGTQSMTSNEPASGGIRTTTQFQFQSVGDGVSKDTVYTNVSFFR